MKFNKIKCKIGFHNYNKGHYVVTHYLHRLNNPDIPNIINNGYYDFRFCLHCRKMEYNYGKIDEERTKWFNMDKKAQLEFERYQRIEDLDRYKQYVVDLGKPECLRNDEIERLNKILTNKIQFKL